MRSDRLEKELDTKDHYVKELEDIIVKKEATICELKVQIKSGHRLLLYYRSPAGWFFTLCLSSSMTVIRTTR